MSEREIKVNLGCGTATLPGFDNIDNSPGVLLSRHPRLKRLLRRVGLISDAQYQVEWPRDIIWRDASKRLPYADASVAKIYSSHFLEHLPREKGLAVLRECRRILRPGGVFRLVVPDLLYHARRYVERTQELIRRDSDSRQAHDEFLETVCGGYLDRRRSAHQYMYDWPTLRRILRETGFVRVRRMNYRESEDPELASLDNRPEESLYVEMNAPEA